MAVIMRSLFDWVFYLVAALLLAGCWGAVLQCGAVSPDLIAVMTVLSLAVSEQETEGGADASS